MSELNGTSKLDQVFAIVRVDSFHHHDAAPEDTITVKKIVLNRQLAEDEVARLNALNRDKGCSYFWQVTRLERSGEPAKEAAGASGNSTSMTTTATDR